MPKKISTVLVACVLFVAACKHRPVGERAVDLGPPVLVNEYHAADFSWDTVDRVVVLPFRNESPHPRAAEEVAENLRAEMQLLGRFEVVATPNDSQAKLAQDIRLCGRFNEATMIDVARATSASLILHGTITQYSPYPRPRLGVVIQVVDPSQGKVVASVDGLWDSTDIHLAARIREFYRTNPYRTTFGKNNRIPPDDGFSGDIALDSPRLFQRYVLGEAIFHLVPGGLLDGAALGGDQVVPTGMTSGNSAACGPNAKNCRPATIPQPTNAVPLVGPKP